MRRLVVVLAACVVVVGYAAGPGASPALAEPMFFSDNARLGPFPYEVLGFGLLGVGFLWIRRITRGEVEPRSFRATAPQPHDHLAIAGLVAVAALLLVAVVLPLVEGGAR